MKDYFGLRRNGTNVKTEMIAGITTFVTMAYILSLAPTFLSDAGMDWGRVFTATAISSAAACFLMGLHAKLPFALAPGIGMSAFFSYTVCIGMGHSWKFALTAVLVEGIIFMLLSVFRFREAIVNSIPLSLKKSFGVGIGFFIAFIGLKNAGIIIDDESNFVGLETRWMMGAPAVALIGALVGAVLIKKGVGGALLISMLVATLVGIPLGVTSYAGGNYFPSAPYFLEYDFREITASADAIRDFIVVTFVFLFDDVFNTIGSLIGCAGSVGMLKEDGSVPRIGQALFSDAVGTVVGSVFGAPTVTTFVESSAGVVAGGRTGFTAMVTGGMFVVSLFLSPIFASIPSAATASALILVGMQMVKPIREIDFSEDMAEAIPAFMTILMMVCTSSIPNGIMFGIFAYVLIKVFTGKYREISVALWIICGMFAASALLSALN